VVGLVLLPGPDLGLRVLVLALAVVAVAACWAALGARLPGRPAVLRRAAASWLGVLAAGLASGGLAV
jgi:hypothetical protein